MSTIEALRRITVSLRELKICRRADNIVLVVGILDLDGAQELLKGGFLAEDGFGVAEHFKKPSLAVKGEEGAEDGLGIARQAHIGGAVIGDGAWGGGLREVGISDCGEPDLLAPAVDVGEESPHVAGENRDGNGGGAIGTAVIELSFANPGGGLFDPSLGGIELKGAGSLCRFCHAG